MAQPRSTLGAKSVAAAATGPEDRPKQTRAPQQPARTRGGSSDEIYDALFESLLRGELKPGDRVREAELAERYGVSRTPIREAMQRLENQGLLVHEPRKGASIRKLDQQAITELYLLRGVLEGMAAAEAAQHASEAEIDALSDLIEDSAAPDADPVHTARTNKAFHDAIHRAAHNRFLVSVMEGLTATMTLLGKTTLGAKARASAAQTEHHAIVEAIAARRPDAAREAAEAHIRAAHRARLRMLLDAELEEFGVED